MFCILPCIHICSLHCFRRGRPSVLPGLEFHPQRRLHPVVEDTQAGVVLVRVPSAIIPMELNFIVPEDLANDQAHLHVGETCCMVSRYTEIIGGGGAAGRKGTVNTYFLPMQPRGPRENGFEAPNLSVVFSLSSHLSGLNLYGSLKFLSLCVAPHMGTDTVV